MLKNAVIIGPITDPQIYHAVEPGRERGKPGFIMHMSDLKEFAACPSKWMAGAPKEATDSMEFGTVLDCLVLTPEHFKARFEVEPATYEKTVLQCPSCDSISTGKKCRECGVPREETTIEEPWSSRSTHCKEWAEAQVKAGKQVIEKELFDNAFAATQRLQQDKIITAFVASSERQVMVIAEWHDAATGVIVPVRILIDALPKLGTAFEKKIGDLKSCASSMPGAWKRQVFNMQYHWQAAFYMDVYKAARPDEDRCDFVHLIQENKPPYQTGRRVVPMDTAMVNGRAAYRRALENYCWCLKHNTWPDNDCDDYGVPGWGVYQWNPYWDGEELFMPKFQTKVVEQAPVEDPDVTA